MGAGPHMTKAIIHKKIESKLRNLPSYKVGLHNLKTELDSIMPNCVASYSASGGSMQFNLSSSTESYALDRIESTRAILLTGQIDQYTREIEALERGIQGLDDVQREYVERRYFQKKKFAEAARLMSVSERTLSNIRKNALEELSISLLNLLG